VKLLWPTASARDVAAMRLALVEIKQHMASASDGTGAGSWPLAAGPVDDC